MQQAEICRVMWAYSDTLPNELPNELTSKMTNFLSLNTG